MFRKPLDIEYLKSRFEYDTETGDLRWKPKPLFKKFDNRWNIRFAGKIAGCVNWCGYTQIGLDGKAIFAHRIVWAIVLGEQPPEIIDHKNRNKTDNRIENLTTATTSTNAFNKEGYSSSGFKGVHKDRNKWRARIMIDGRDHNLGSFDTPEEAADAYRLAAAKLHGEFACTDHVNN